jgi:hypothetical protein
VELDPTWVISDLAGDPFHMPALGCSRRIKVLPVNITYERSPTSPWRTSYKVALDVCSTLVHPTASPIRLHQTALLACASWKLVRHVTGNLSPTSTRQAPPGFHFPISNFHFIFHGRPRKGRLRKSSRGHQGKQKQASDGRGRERCELRAVVGVLHDAELLCWCEVHTRPRTCWEGLYLGYLYLLEKLEEAGRVEEGETLELKRRRHRRVAAGTDIIHLTSPSRLHPSSIVVCFDDSLHHTTRQDDLHPATGPDPLPTTQVRIGQQHGQDDPTDSGQRPLPRVHHLHRAARF